MSRPGSQGPPGFHGKGSALLTDTQLQGAHLMGSDLAGAMLRDAQLQGARLMGADLRGACLRGADLTGARMDGADLTGADVRGAIGVGDTRRIVGWDRRSSLGVCR